LGYRVVKKLGQYVKPSI